MARLVWDAAGARKFETGVSNGVLYLSTGVGVPWNGLISVAEKTENKQVVPLYLDGFKYLDLVLPGEFGATITAYTYPDEFLDYDGFATSTNGMLIDSQSQKKFGLSYRTTVGNDTLDVDYGYKIHVLYDLTAISEDPEYTTLGDSTSPIEFSWSITSRPTTVTGYRPTSHIVIDSKKVSAGVLTQVENLLYGTVSTTASLPTIAALLALV